MRNDSPNRNSEFKKLVADLVSKFGSNAVIKKIESGNFLMSDYHKILCVLFHQVSWSATTFSLAAARCKADQWPVKSYFMHHAEEEKTHWEWILNDLRNTGYKGPSPDQLNPNPLTQAYISLNYFVAETNPIARLAIAAVLESIGARYGKKIAMKACELLKLNESQMEFFIGHGVNDVDHTRDIFDVLEQTPLSEKEWNEMFHFARVAADLYTRMYDEAFLDESWHKIAS